MALLLIAAMGPVRAESGFPPPGPDILHTSNLSLIDPEYNVDKRLVTWVDAVSGDIWVARFDYETGAFVPADGKGVLIEAAVAKKGEYGGLGFTVNGPEWALGTPSDYIVYTRTDARGEPKPGNAVVGVAYQNADGSWSRQSLAAPQRYAPYGSLNRNAPAKVSYQGPKGTWYARDVADPSSEGVLPDFARTGAAPPTARFVDGANLVVYQAIIDGLSQTVAYDLDTQTPSQLTFDAGAKVQSWMWSAPELGGQLALMAVVDKRTVVMYRPVAGADGAFRYEPHAAVAAPQRGRWFSVEPFVYRGRSYMVAQLTPKGSSYPTSIWLAGFDAADPVLRQLTPDGDPTEARADPEMVPTAHGVLVVYSKFDTAKCAPENTSSWLCIRGLKGLFRADTGLPPPH